MALACARWSASRPKTLLDVRGALASVTRGARGTGLRNAPCPSPAAVPGASSSAPGGSGAPPPKPAVDLDAIAKAKKALELQKQLAGASPPAPRRRTAAWFKTSTILLLSITRARVLAPRPAPAAQHLVPRPPAAERLKKIPKAAPPGAKPAPVQDALPQPSADEEWYLARRAARHSRPRALEFVDRGKYQLQAEFNRAVAR